MPYLNLYRLTQLLTECTYCSVSPLHFFFFKISVQISEVLLIHSSYHHLSTNPECEHLPIACFKRVFTHQLQNSRILFTDSNFQLFAHSLGLDSELAHKCFYKSTC